MRHLYILIFACFVTTASIMLANASTNGSVNTASNNTVGVNTIDSTSSTGSTETTSTEAESANLTIEPQIIHSTNAVVNLPDYMEKTYFYNIDGKYAYAKDTNLVFEAQLAPAFTIYNNVSKPKLYTSAMTVSSEVHIRMLYTHSVPLVPPSYLVHLKYFGFLRDKSSGDIKNTFMISLNHHSNGKSANIIGKSQLNLENGNFSTHYLQFFWYHTFRQSNGKFPVKYDMGIGFEKHIPDSLMGFEVAGAMIDPLSENFGRNRIWLSYSSQQKIASSIKLLNGSDLRFLINYMYVLNQPKGNFLQEFKNPEVLPRYMLNAEVQFKPNWRSNFGFFCRLRSGQDDYNSYFFKNLTQFQFGFVADQFQFKRN